LGLGPSEIRCTSVDGYRLPGGADTDEQIRIEVDRAEVLVGIISTASLDSLYVAFELGARWGTGKCLIPLMAPGLSPSTIKGPLGGKNALRSDSAGQLQQLVADVGAQLGIAAFPAASYQSDLDAILSFASSQVATAQSKQSAERPREMMGAQAEAELDPRAAVMLEKLMDAKDETILLAELREQSVREFDFKLLMHSLTSRDYIRLLRGPSRDPAPGPPAVCITPAGKDYLVRRCERLAAERAEQERHSALLKGIGEANEGLRRPSPWKIGNE